MNFFQRLAGRVNPSNVTNSANTEVQDLTLDSEALRQAIAAATTVDNVRVNDKTVLAIPTALRAITLLSNAVAGLPLDFINRTDESRTPVTNHPVVAAFTRKPNQFQSAYEFRRLLQTHLSFRGNAYARIIQPLRSDGDIELLPINPDAIKPVMTSDGLRVEYEFRNKRGQVTRFKQDEIFHLRGLSLDGFTGVSPLTLARQALALSMQGQNAASKTFTKGTLSGFALKHPGKLTEKAKNNISESYEKLYGGADNAGRPPVLEEGMEPVNLGFSAADTQFLESRRFSVADVARIWGMPPHMVGDTERSTSWGTGIEQQTIGFVTYTLDEWINIWETSIERQFLADDPDIQARKHTSALLRGDNKTRWNIYFGAVKHRILTPNQCLALEDMPPYDGGDEFPNLTGQPDDEENGDEDDENPQRRNNQS